jgi:hypothetical protein
MKKTYIEESKDVVIFGHGDGDWSLALLAFTDEEDLLECSTLTKDEQSMLNRCEQVIQRDHEAITQCGESLATVRKGKLYREKFKSFKQYCRERWGFAPVKVNRLRRSASITADLQQWLEASAVSLPLLMAAVSQPETKATNVKGEEHVDL